MKSLIWKWEKIRTLSPRDMCIAVDLTRSRSKKSGHLLENCIEKFVDDLINTRNQLQKRHPDILLVGQQINNT